MSMKNALRTILVIALAGLTFSGVLVYRELFAAAASCSPVGASGTILGYPPCIYGFVMYAAIVTVAIVGLVSHKGDASHPVPSIA
jgi:hypothetical protein